MSLTVKHLDLEDARRIVEALLEKADRADVEHHATLARRLRAIADDYGDALDQAVPKPSGYRRGHPYPPPAA